MNRPGRTTWVLLTVVGVAAGCYSTPSAHTVSHNYALREDYPTDPPGGCDDEAYRAGGRLYQMYCGACHNARPLSERPFSNNEVTLAHMREQAYLTGWEYRQLLHFLRRWHDLGPPTPDVPPSPKRFFYNQPINELRPEPGPKAGAGGESRQPAPAAPQQPGAPDAGESPPAP
jgi:hypothetical protein